MQINMFSLFKKKKKNAKIDNVSRSKYYLDKELLLKGIIYEEKKLEEEYIENQKVLPSMCLLNKTNSPYFDLVSELEKTYDRKDLHRREDYVDKEGNVSWGRLLNVKKTKDLNEVFVDSMSINLNIEDVEQYQKILKEELVEVNKNLGLYKSSWGYLNELTLRSKKLDSNIKFLKKNKLFVQSQSLKIDLVVEFDFFGSGSIDVYRQYFKVEEISKLKSLNLELNSEDCLKLLKLRNWSASVKEDINDYLKIRKSGFNPGKQNNKLTENVDNELDIDISKLDIN